MHETIANPQMAYYFQLAYSEYSLAWTNDFCGMGVAAHCYVFARE